jgi:serine/threonine protein kinase
MNQADWKKVQKLFNEAIELQKEERLQYLKEQCGQDLSLYNEVISLLSADEDIHPVLNKKASDLINIEEKLNFVGQQIGNYKIVEEIATGGMGTVFLAERCDGFFEQKVALKIVKPGLSTIPIIRRFQHERQILANLQHPNIARLFDGGITEDKRPFFTMEYVDGIPIDEYCDKNKLTINERLKLFIKVCEAVQYAHNNLVIHRDLKPSNILIKSDGTIKLLDFGISKVLSAESENQDLPTITQAEINLLTPEYSSPEQIKNSNISVSTDVYSLGLILYKLLSGKSAHEFKARTFNEYEKVVCEQTITKPSTVLHKENVGENEFSAVDISRVRKTQPKKLKNILNGDLDNICLMALRKEPERRYASVEMLAYDIERYLSSLPILARKESMAYTTKKFVIRNKTVVITAIALFFIVNGLILFYTIQLKNERDRATKEARKSEQAASFLTDLFLVSDPNQSKGETITARELLDRGASRLMAGLEEEPEMKSQLLNTIGKVYTNLGLYNSAEEIFLEIKGNKNLEVVDKETYTETLVNLGKTYGFNGKYELAGDLLMKAKNEGEKYLPPFHPLLGDIYNTIGGHYYQTAVFDSSYEFYRKAEQNFLINYGKESQQLATNLYNLGVLEFDKGNLQTSDSLYRKSLEMYLNINGELDAQTATAQNELASVLRHSGKFDEAEKLYLKALETRIKIFGNEHPDVAHTLNHISRLYYNQEQFEKAEPYVRQSLEIREKLYDVTHPEVSASKSSLAGTLMGLKQYEEAEKLYESAYNASMKKFGESHPYTPAILGNLATALMEQKKYKEAEEAMLNALRMLDKLNSYRPSYRSSRILSLADLYNRTNRFSKAEELLRNELRLLKSNENDEDWLIGLTESELGYSLFKQSKNIEAEGLLVNGYNTIKKYKGEKSYISKKALKKIIDFYKSKGREDKVLEYETNY